MIRKPLVLGTATLLALALVAVGSSSDSSIQASHLVGVADRIAIDTDPTGNTATSLGTREDCVVASLDTDVSLQVTVKAVPAYSNNGTPANYGDDTGGIIGFAYLVTYDPVALSVSARDVSGTLLGANAGSSAFDASDPEPDTDGEFFAQGADTATGGAAGTTEQGDGVLHNITIHVDANAASGLYPLFLFDGGIVDAQSIGKAAAELLLAQIAVGVTCTAAPPPPPIIMGDVDCSNTVTSVDALKVLRSNAGLSVAQTGNCIDIGISTTIDSTPPNVHIGDVDCGGSVNSVDALKILRKNANLSVTQTEPCDDIGT